MINYIDYITGSSGFIGRKLSDKHPTGAYEILHDDLKFYPRGKASCRRFYFLSTYGNMAHHEELGAIYKANVLDVHHVLTKCKPELFVFLSSSSVNLPVQTPYSIAKRCAEALIMTSGVPNLIIRPYSVTGVGEQKEHLIPRLIDSCLNGTRMDFVPEPTHDFIDVEDLVDAIMMLIEDQRCGTFEIGSGMAWTNAAVRSIVEEECGRPANVQIRKSMRSYDNANWKCRENPMWKPKKTLMTSIKEMVAHAKQTR